MVTRDFDTYTYVGFSRKQLEDLMRGWDSYGGLHGSILRKCAELVIGDSVLDVGCGFCHLYKLIQDKVSVYVGIDNDRTILEMAKKKHPELDIRFGDVYDLSTFPNFDSVVAVGLYNHDPNTPDGILEMLKHSKKCLIFTYSPTRKPQTGVVDSLDLNMERYSLGAFDIIRVFV